MWNKLAKRKNRFLQKQIPYMKPIDINNDVCKEFDDHLKELLEVCPSDNQFCETFSSFKEDRAPLAFGVRALPKLIKEICSDTPIVQWRAINSLKEVLKDPLEAYRAVLRFDIIRKLQNLLLGTRRKNLIKGEKLTVVVLKIMHILAIYLVAAREIGRRHNLLNELYDMISMNDQSDLCSRILMRTSAHPLVILHFLKCTDAFCRVTGLIRTQNSNDLPKYLWIHCSHFIELAPAYAVQLGYYELLQEKICNINQEINKGIIMKCFALLLECEEGREKLDKYDGVRMLYNLLTNDNIEIHEHIVLALQNATHSRKAIMRCCAFWDLPLILAGRAQDKNNYRLQLYCLQTLRQISQMPVVKGFVKKVCRDEIIRIQSESEHVCQAKTKLIKWLDKRIHDSCSKIALLQKSKSSTCYQ